jgi:Na+-transporting NADH:ubiquinone oxidoreductase subunit NqrB
MTTYTTHYELAGRARLTLASGEPMTGAIVWKNVGGIEGVKAWARDERTGEYVRILETAPTEWVDNEPQTWASGNFETVDAAKKFASMAYRYINKNRKAA